MVNLSTEEKPPFKNWDGTDHWIYKTNTLLRRTLLDLAEFVPVMLACERALQDEDAGMSYTCEYWGQYINFAANNDAHARRIVGKLWRTFGKPQIEKPTEDTMRARWQVGKIRISVDGYKPKTCRYEETKVELPAEPERVEIVEAKPARTERRRVLVCDDAQPDGSDAVVAAIEIQEHVDVEEVPF